MDSSLWNLFHDATLAAAEGSVPGDVLLTIECDYLRKMFPEAGAGFTVRLRNCSLFEFEPYDQPPCADLAAIGQLEPEILSAESGNPLEICCTGGTLRLRYVSAETALDSGKAISLVELDSAAERYWGRWEQEHRAAP